MGRLQRETWAVSLWATSRTDSRNHQLSTDLSILWITVSLKSEQDKWWNTASCTTLLSFALDDSGIKGRDGDVKWKYWIQLLSTLQTAIMFFQDSLQSVWWPNKKAYMVKTPEKLAWERNKKLLIVWIFWKHTHLPHLQRKVNRTSKLSHFISLKINVYLLHSIWCSLRKKMKVFQTKCFHSLDFLLCTHLPHAGVISIQTTIEVLCCYSGTFFQVLR